MFSSSDLTHLGPRHTKPGLQAGKNRAHHKYKQNIAMTGCLQAGIQYNHIVRHRYILFVFMVSSVFFRLQSRLSIFWALGCKHMVRSFFFFFHDRSFYKSVRSLFTPESTFNVHKNIQHILNFRVLAILVII